MDQNKHKDQRRHRRFVVDLMDIQGSALLTTSSIIHDISINGISLITDQELEIGKAYTIRLFDDKLDMPLQATVIRSSQHPEGYSPCNTSPAYLTGLQFHDLTQDTVLFLEKFIKSHIIGRGSQVDFHQLSGCRFNVRFQTDRNETTLLDLPETYKVIKLSLGGMLIACSHSFHPETRLHMTITIPDNIKLAFTGRVASCIPSKQHTGCFDIGIEFQNMPDKDRAALKAFIKELYINDSGL